MRGDKLRIDADVFKGLFKKTTDNIIEEVNAVLHNEITADLSQILLLGGFAECEIVQDALRQKFTQYRLIVLKQCELSIRKGAVIYGHDPYVIRYRCSRFTYGIETAQPFIQRLHKEEYEIFMEGQKLCRNLFEIVVGRKSELVFG